MNNISVDVEKMLSGMIAAMTEGIKVSSNKEITVDNIIDIMKSALDGAGIGNTVVIDFQPAAVKKIL